MFLDLNNFLFYALGNLYMRRKDKIEKTISLLKKEYGRLDLGLPSLSPVDMLIQTILSQNNNDIVTSRTFKRLKKKYRNWDQLLATSNTSIERDIRDNGLYKAKTRFMKNALKQMKKDFGRITLDPLKKMETKEARKWLESIKGVGPKTAGVVMAFSFGRAAFPVDTHVYRIVTRLGIVPESTRTKVQKTLEEEIPEAKQALLHTLLINHGKTICIARKPKCLECVLKGFCSSKKLYY